MGAVLILTPVIIGSWPAITTAVAGAAAAMGLMVSESVKETLNQGQSDAEQTVELELSDSEVLAESMATDQEIVLTKGAIELRVKRDERGRCSVCAKGTGHSELETRIFRWLTKKFQKTKVFEYMFEDGWIKIWHSTKSKLQYLKRAKLRFI
ncbi:MAG: hypothetical protein ACYS9Y_01995 [Planctomycetota bacterium]|jgi:hypothetical protein